MVATHLPLCTGYMMIKLPFRQRLNYIKVLVSGWSGRDGVGGGERSAL